MSRSVLAALFAVLLTLGACSDDDGATTTTSTLSTTADGTVSVPAAPKPADAIACEAMQDANFELIFSNQILASLVSNDQFELIADGTIDVDFSAVREAVAVLRPLEDVEPNPVGSVADGLDRIDRVAALAAVAIEADDPSSTPAFAEIQTLIADDATFIQGIGPINYAYGDACQT